MEIYERCTLFGGKKASDLNGLCRVRREADVVIG